jgi:hypothetical protein
MQSNDHRDETDSTPQEDRESQPRPIAKVSDTRGDRFSGDHIHLSPRAQRRMAMGRRSAF